MLNRNDDHSYRHLMPDLKGKTFFVSSLTVFSVNRGFFFKTAFISLRKLPYIPYILRMLFINERMFDIIKSLFCICFFFNIYIFIILYFIYLFLAVLGLRFCARAFSNCSERGPLFIAVRGPLTITASLVAEHRLQTRRLSSCGSRA